MNQKVAAIIDEHKSDKGQLISILQDVQAELHYLPKESLIQVSDTMDIPLSRVYSVATFFKAFSLKPRGKHLIDVCLGTACHVRGAPKLLDQLERFGFFIDVERYWIFWEEYLFQPLSDAYDFDFVL